MRSQRRATQRSALKSHEGMDVPGELRRRLGRWLRDQRLSAGLTQADLAEAVGLDGTNGISAIENGRANIQPERYGAYCKALGLDHVELAKVVLRHTDPWLYKTVFNSREQLLADEIRLMTAEIPKGHNR